jgi:hypothetical protein
MVTARVCSAAVQHGILISLFVSLAAINGALACCCCCYCCQALFAREDQAGGKRKVGASMLTNLFSSSIRLVGKMRVRLSTITPNAPINITMPLQGAYI